MSASPANEINAIREASRLIVRELGMLQAAHGSLKVSNSEVHALLYLSVNDGTSPIILANHLLLEKSTVSRLLQGLEVKKLIRTEIGDDRRKKILALTPQGKLKVKQIHSQAIARVESALSLLSAQERKMILQGLILYGTALTKSRLEENIK